MWIRNVCLQLSLFSINSQANNVPYALKVIIEWRWTKLFMLNLPLIFVGAIVGCPFIPQHVVMESLHSDSTYFFNLFWLVSQDTSAPSSFITCSFPLFFSHLSHLFPSPLVNSPFPPFPQKLLLLPAPHDVLSFTSRELFSLWMGS